MTLILIGLAILAGFGLLLYWLLIMTEGVYLGQRMVTRLYDRVAPRYDRIKQYDAEWETATLAEPILNALRTVEYPLLLDVGTGTARLAETLFASGFNGQFVGLDDSLPMLEQAAPKLAQVDRSRFSLIQQSAVSLPFDDATFDCVACLEALEFMPDPTRVLAEMARVAKPGALLVLSNRKGWQAWLMPSKTQRTAAFHRHLIQVLHLEDVTPTIWQVDYDLIWAFKPGLLPETGPCSIGSLLRCPVAATDPGHRFVVDADCLTCTACGARLLLTRNGVIRYESVTAM